jgi:C-3',4' desaturase CrtD
MSVQNPIHLFKNSAKEFPEDTEVLVIGSGMGSMSAAVLLAKEGIDVVVCEQNYLPGGCSSSYLRQGNIFESGATTLVGLDEGMPLAEILRRTGIQLKVQKLEMPMQVRLSDGTVIQRHGTLDKWITEAEDVFGIAGQRSFWEECMLINKRVWDVSSRQVHFPPDSLSDVGRMLGAVELKDFDLLPYFMKTMKDLLIKHGLDRNQRFIDFVDEQLMITAQNKHCQVNALFGATALCYTLQGNYYVPGGMIEILASFSTYLSEKGSSMFLKTRVTSIHRDGNAWKVQTNRGAIRAKSILCGIPANNLIKLIQEARPKKFKLNVLPIEKLNAAVQLGIVFKSDKRFETLHYQFHHKIGFPIQGSGSLFLSLSHPDDRKRSIEGEYVGSVSTHVSLAVDQTINKQEVAEIILQVLKNEGFFKTEDVQYYHLSAPNDWEEWTLREGGFVGGYPQFKDIAPWKMNSARVAKGLYLCGDSAYPGQGIPGAALSGLIAFEKIKLDTLRN